MRPPALASLMACSNTVLSPPVAVFHSIKIDIRAAVVFFICWSSLPCATLYSYPSWEHKVVYWPEGNLVARARSWLSVTHVVEALNRYEEIKRDIMTTLSYCMYSVNNPKDAVQSTCRLSLVTILLLNVNSIHSKNWNAELTF